MMVVGPGGRVGGYIGRRGGGDWSQLRKITNLEENSILCDAK
jgi:hypothetical protein